MASTRSSDTIILHRQVTIVYLGLANFGKVGGGCLVVGLASGRQPQEIPNSCHCVLRLRGGGNAIVNLDSGDEGDDEDDSGDAHSGIEMSPCNRDGCRLCGERCAGHGSCLGIGAVGIGVCDDRNSFDDGGGGEVNVASARVLANEEGCMNDGVGHVFPIFVEGAGSSIDLVGRFIEEQEGAFDQVMGRIRLRSRLPDNFVFSPLSANLCPRDPAFKSILYDVPLVAPRGVSPVSIARSSLVVAGSQDGNHDRSAILDGGAISAPNSNRVDTGRVKEELSVRSSVVFGSVSYLVPQRGPSIEIRQVGGQWVSPKIVSHEWFVWCRPSVRRPVVVSHSSSVGVGLPAVGRSPTDIPGDGDDRLLRFVLEDLRHQCDAILVRCFGYPGNGGQLLPASTLMYNQFVGGCPLLVFMASLV